VREEERGREKGESDPGRVSAPTVLYASPVVE
jgi:hypothetical protein